MKKIFTRFLCNLHNNKGETKCWGYKTPPSTTQEKFKKFSRRFYYSSRGIALQMRDDSRSLYKIYLLLPFGTVFHRFFPDVRVYVGRTVKCDYASRKCIHKGNKLSIKLPKALMFNANFINRASFWCFVVQKFPFCSPKELLSVWLRELSLPLCFKVYSWSRFDSGRSAFCFYIFLWCFKAELSYFLVAWLTDEELWTGIAENFEK